MWRIVWVGMGLPCHDGKVEGVVVEDDAVLVLGHECFRAGCRDMRNLSASLARPRKATIEGPIAAQADIMTGVKIVLLPAS